MFRFLYVELSSLGLGIVFLTCLVVLGFLLDTAISCRLGCVLVCISLLIVHFLDADQHDLHGNDSIDEGEDFDTDRELLAILLLSAEILRSALEQGDDFLHVMEIDADREDGRLILRRDQRSEILLQLFFHLFALSIIVKNRVNLTVVNLLFIEASRQTVLHIIHVALDIRHHFPGEIHIRLCNVSDGSYLQNGCFDFLSQ